ncbi:prepilin-type N-terminal cleavage/methylation domain-containing protein [Candidatus Giovannonibacteria bacterium]|nr:prepilin-type N-terminal cleavage/methylation domain-containing protein [Candidatus Giovannonibacteria bacterium]
MNFFKQRLKRGFTLIELLVVISIISLLASVTLASTKEARRKARDARRLQDMRQITIALELYYGEHGKYPLADPGGQKVCVVRSSASWVGGDCIVVQDLNSELASYIRSLPVDPLNNNGGFPPFICCGYTYFVRPDGSDYDLISIFEDDNAQRCSRRNWVSHTGGWPPPLPEYPGVGNSWCGSNMTPFPDAQYIWADH